MWAATLVEAGQDFSSRQRRRHVSACMLHFSSSSWKDCNHAKPANLKSILKHMAAAGKDSKARLPAKTEHAVAHLDTAEFCFAAAASALCSHEQQ